MLNTVKKIFLLLVLAFISVTSAQNSLIEINSKVDTSRISIGDRIKYVVTIDYSDSLEIEHPGVGINLGQFEIKDYKIHEAEKKDDRIFQKYEYTISVFDTGSFTIPPFPIAYFPKDSIQNYKLIEASAINIYVESILGEGEQELKDVKAPIYIPFDYVLLISVIAIVLLLALGGYFGYRFYKAKKEEGFSLIPQKPKKPAHEIALEAYKKLQNKDLLNKGLLKEYYTKCSEILRKYLEDRYFIVALEETTGEILRDMKSQEIKKDYTDNLKQILELSDFVKFAKYVPDKDENNTILGNCIDFVENTKIEFIQKIEKTEEVVEINQT